MGQQWDALAKQIGVPVIFPEEQTGQFGKSLQDADAETRQLCYWHALLC